MTATNDGIIHLKGRIRDGKLVALLDHEGKELGAPVTALESVTGRNEILGANAALNERDYSSNVLSWCLGGYLAAPVDVVTNPYSQMLQTVLEGDFDSVRIGVLNAAAAAVNGVKVAVAAGTTLGTNAGTLGLAATGQPTGSLVNFTTATINLTAAAADSTGATGSNIGGADCAVTWTPWFGSAVSVPRADGSSGLPELNVIVTWPAGGKRTFIEASGGADATNLGDETLALNRPVRSMIAAIRDACGNPAWMLASNGSAVRSYTEFAPIIIQYTLRNGKGRTLVVFGDSITEGSGSSVARLGWHREWQNGVSKLTNPVSICNLAVAGTDQINFKERIAATISELGICTAFVPSLTPNGLSAPIVANDIILARPRFGENRRQLNSQAIRLITSTIIPTNYSVKAYGASDVTYRVAWNNQLLATDFDVADFSAVASSATVDVNGQYSMVSSADGIHPDTPLYKLMAGAFGLVW